MQGNGLPQLDEQMPALVRRDVVIVGGGPAGIIAALTLSELNIDVLLIDEHEIPGGQYYKPRAEGLVATRGSFRPRGEQIRARLKASNVEVWSSSFVWGVSDDREQLLVSRTTEAGDTIQSRIKFRKLICATGAYEAMIPFPGWTNPRVITAGYALHLAACDGVRVGRRVVLAGSGPFLLQVACELIMNGSKVEAVVEAGAPYSPSLTSASALRFPARIKEFLHYRGLLALHRVPVLQQSAVTAVRDLGPNGVQATITGLTTKSSRVFEADTVAIGYGFRPSTELARMLGCGMTTIRPEGEEFVATDGFGRTSRNDIFAIGEISGIAGVHAAMARGEQSALAIASALGKPVPTRRQKRLARVTARLDAFAALNRVLFPFPEHLFALMQPDTIACRCEAVTVENIHADFATGWNDRDAVKGSSRAGMGICQGRECFRTLQWLTGGAAGIGRSEGANCEMSRAQVSRIPIKPLLIDDLLERDDVMAVDTVREDGQPAEPIA